MTFQWCMLSILSKMIGKFLEIFIDKFFGFELFFDTCIEHLRKMITRDIEKNLVLS